MITVPLRFLARPWLYASRTASFIWYALLFSVRPRTWRRPVREVLSRQILFTGIEALLFVSFIALLVGISVVAQAQVWLTRFGQKQFLGDVLVLVIVREAAPLLTNFVVIGRSGTAISTELANMKIAGELKVLEAYGIDPFTYLVVPRILGVMLSVFSLTVFFIVFSFSSGYVTGLMLGAQTGQPGIFVRSVFKALGAPGLINVAAKTFIPGLATGAICCLEGLSVKTALTEVPQAGTRALVRSSAALFMTSALVSVLTYF